MPESYLNEIAKVIAKHFSKIDDVVLKEPIFREVSNIFLLYISNNF